MSAKQFSEPLIIKEIHLDMFGHMNNAIYLTLFEQARWDLITANGYGIEKIRESGLGPVVLGVKIQYKKELRLRDEIIIESQILSYERKIATMQQNMVRKEEICCTAEFTFALFDLHRRKLIAPTLEWLKAIGFQTATV